MRRDRIARPCSREILQLVAGLVAEQILDGVKHRAGMRLHRDAILRPHTEKYSADMMLASEADEA